MEEHIQENAVMVAFRLKGLAILLALLIKNLTH
jgi:hypothetical protein